MWRIEDKMNKIGMEKENIVRIILNALLLVSALSFMIVICLEDIGFLAFFITFLLIILSSFGIIVEIYECIFFDDKHLEIRSLLGHEKINYPDIVSIERVLVRNGKPNIEHFRWYVKTKTQDGIQKKIIVPFPQSIENKNLQHLFSKIKSANCEVQWGIPSNG